jgi:hypothetical protein
MDFWTFEPLTSLLTVGITIATVRAFCWWIFLWTWAVGLVVTWGNLGLQILFPRFAKPLERQLEACEPIFKRLGPIVMWGMGMLMADSLLAMVGPSEKLRLLAVLAGAWYVHHTMNERKEKPDS